MEWIGLVAWFWFQLLSQAKWASVVSPMPDAPNYSPTDPQQVTEVAPRFDPWGVPGLSE